MEISANMYVRWNGFNKKEIKKFTGEEFIVGEFGEIKFKSGDCAYIGVFIVKQNNGCLIYDAKMFYRKFKTKVSFI